MQVKRTSLTFLFLSLLSVGFYQSCGDVEFSTEQLEKSSGDPIICNPFETQANCDNSGDTINGLKGNLYYLTEEQAKESYSSRVRSYIQFGKRVPYVIYMSKLDVAPRAWDSGFPAGQSGHVTNEKGESLFEWFALDLRGYLGSPLPDGQEVQFALRSDDGAILELDGDVIIDNDGQHAPRWACASQPTRFSSGRLKQMRMLYNQGPRVTIALQLFYRPWSDNHRPCDGDGGWKIVPKSSFFTRN